MEEILELQLHFGDNFIFTHVRVVLNYLLVNFLDYRPVEPRSAVGFGLTSPHFLDVGTREPDIDPGLLFHVVRQTAISCWWIQG